MNLPKQKQKHLNDAKIFLQAGLIKASANSFAKAAEISLKIKKNIKK